MAMNLSEYLKSEIARRNLSVRKASDHIGISHVTLLRILSGETPNLETLSKIAEWTRTDLAFLLELLGYHFETDALEVQRLARLIEYDPLYRRLFVLLERLGHEELEFAVEYLEYLSWRLGGQPEEQDTTNRADEQANADEETELTEQAESSADVSLRSEG
jgi:transcriptional regulator with XRE-family HTH domain